MELEKLRLKCLLFNNFILKNGNIPAELIPTYEESDRLIEKAFAEKDIKPLKAMSRDIDHQVTRHMPKEMAEKLKEIFRNSLGTDYGVADDTLIRAIERIKKNGKIFKGSEYELVLNRAEDIALDSEKAAELSQLNELLAAYRSQGI